MAENNTEPATNKQVTDESEAAEGKTPVSPDDIATSEDAANKDTTAEATAGLVSSTIDEFNLAAIIYHSQ